MTKKRTLRTFSSAIVEKHISIDKACVHTKKNVLFYKKKKLEVFDSHNFQLGDEKQTDILMKLKI